MRAANPAVTCTLVVNGGWTGHGNGFRWSPFHAWSSGPVHARGAGSIRAAGDVKPKVHPKFHRQGVEQHIKQKRVKRQALYPF